MGLEGIIVGEKSQTEKDKYRMISLTHGLWEQNETKTKPKLRYIKQIGSCQGQGVGGGRVGKMDEDGQQVPTSSSDLTGVSRTARWL